MALGGLRTGAALLFATLVVAHGAYSFAQAERRAREAALTEGEALIHAVASGVRANLEAGQAVERLLVDRLRDLAGDLDGRLAAAPGRETRVLAAFVREHRLRGALHLGADAHLGAFASGVLRAPGTGPASADRIAELEAEEIAKRLAAAGLVAEERLVIGFGESPFGARSEYLVSVPAPRAGGFVALRHDATDLAQFERSAGIKRLLDEAAASDAVLYLALHTAKRDFAVSAGDVTSAPFPEPLKIAGSNRSGRAFHALLPATWPGGGEYQLQVGLHPEPVRAVVDETRRNVVVSTALLLLAGAVAWVFLARRERSSRRREDALRSELEARERFAALGRLAAGVAHEIRSPLNALSMATQRLRREAPPESGPRRERFRELTDAVRDAVGRVDETVEDFLSLGRDARPATPVRLEIGVLVREVAAAEQSDARLEGPGGPLHARADPRLVARGLANLLRNAKEAAPPGTTELSWRREGAEVVIEVTDGGPGIPREEWDRVFEPFRTARRGGTGLGLTIAREAVQRTGGRIVLDGAPSGGARFAIRLPGGDA